MLALVIAVVLAKRRWKRSPPTILRNLRASKAPSSLEMIVNPLHRNFDRNHLDSFLHENSMEINRSMMSETDLDGEAPTNVNTVAHASADTAETSNYIPYLALVHNQSGYINAQCNPNPSYDSDYSTLSEESIDETRRNEVPVYANIQGFREIIPIG